ncbi:hypothetical protein FEM48_Zijuj10G0128300 [Ziziphus jujuba var. spinosa]|uniref:Uncharacterized protein n=1 Tax=Ziziphus jujuba var. spinosa TaxID=714518 RepID=A0A978UNH2_ZIZJJ|nr:hypothetical protein FEM48_Zijuj10G0128300 [Ziziphus jujuba var. spinosa]
MQLVNSAFKVPNSSFVLPSNTLNSMQNFEYVLNDHLFDNGSYGRNYYNDHQRRFYGRGCGRGRGERFFKPRCQICDQIGHTTKVYYCNSGNSVFHNAGLTSNVGFQNAFGRTQSHLVQHAFTPTSGVFGPYSRKVDFNSGPVPSHSRRRALTIVPETDEVCEDQAYNKPVSISAKNTSLCVLSCVLDPNDQDFKAANETVVASSDAPLVLLRSVSVSPTPTASSIGQPDSTLMSGENLQIYSTSSVGHAIHNNDSILTSSATQIPHNNGDPASSTSNRSQSAQEFSPVTSPSHASLNPTTVSDV